MKNLLLGLSILTATQAIADTTGRNQYVTHGIELAKQNPKSTIGFTIVGLVAAVYGTVKVYKWVKWEMEKRALKAQGWKEINGKMYAPEVKFARF